MSRKVLVGLGAAGSIAVFGATIWALQANRHSRLGEELYSTDNKSPADDLANLPRDYTGLPRNVPLLGPPLPGDLGRPIVAAQADGQPVIVPPMPTEPAVDPEEQRRLQEREAARLSKLFAGTSVREQSVALRTSGPDATSPPPSFGQNGIGGPANDDPDYRQNGQERKLAFANGPAERRTVTPDRLQAPASPYVLQAGTVISGALVTGIRSDLPGQITGQVTENVYDSPSGRYLLVPQGAKLIGIYDSQVTFGQSRILLVWTRLIMPDGTSIVLERQPGADTQGFSGLEDEIDDHWGKLFKAAVLSTLLSVGSEAGSTGQQSDLFQALRCGASDSISQTGNQVVRRNLNIQSTLTIRPGFPVRVIVNRDLILAPYGV